MDTQLSNYIVLKNGKPFVDPNGKRILYTLNNAIQMVKILECNMDGYKSRSPYTISKAGAPREDAFYSNAEKLGYADDAAEIDDNFDDFDYLAK